MEILIGLVVLLTVLLSVFLFFKQAKKQAVGICNYTLDQSVRKNANLQKILELFASNKELTNESIRENLKVSNRSVVRYMDELEKQGKVKQIGNTGRSVTYKLI
ncbi:MAG: HTH domain-containing protein [Candidatus Levybacteria bacterium]|nr:HTH domain-containing protein [Candidatus Levybacteria bacterium]